MGGRSTTEESVYTSQVGKLAHCLFFIDKGLLEHRHIRLFTYCLWLLSCHNSRDEWL